MLGKHFSINQVGYFYQGKKIQGVSSQMLNSLSLGVVFSHLSKYQEDRHIFQQHYLRIFSFFSMLTGAIASLVFLLAKDTVQIVLGNIWLGSVIYIQILGIASFFQLHKIFCQNILKVYDRTEKIFIWELIASTIQVASIVLGIILKNIFIMLVGMIASNLLAYLLNSYYSWKILGLKASKELGLICKIIVASVVSTCCTRIVDIINVNAVVSLLLMTALFIVFYVIVLKLLRVFDSNLIFQLFKTSRAK
jgi:O-antigen/teichoic acid export membrane protein